MANNPSSRNPTSANNWSDLARSAARATLGVALLGLTCATAGAQTLSFVNDTPLPIPDLGNASSDIVVTDTDLITNVSVMLRTDHDNTGQLAATLQHVDTGTIITLLHVIGATAAPFGANNDDLWIALSDSALTAVDDADSLHGPPTAIENSYRPDQALAAFNSEFVTGTWRLTVYDLVLGTQDALQAWSISFNAPWTDMGLANPGSFGVARLEADGPLTSSSPYSLTVTDAEPLTFGVLFGDLSMLPYATPFKDGILGPGLTLQLPLNTDFLGGWSLAGTFPGVPPGTEFFMQYWYQDLGKTSQVAATNTVAAVAP